MSEPKSVTNQVSNVSDLLAVAARLPGVHIDRDKFLTSALTQVCNTDQLKLAIETTPARAGISKAALAKLARDVINYETNQVTLISAAAGIPGGLAMLASVPADLLQYFGHMLRVSQKLAYLHGWPTLLNAEGSEPDDETKDVLVLFVGVMSGARGAQIGVTKMSTLIAENVVKQLPRRALTQGTIYPIVKKVAGVLGAKMTERTFASGVGKIVPVVGAVISGSITYFSFKPMAKKLNSHLSRSPLAKTGNKSGGKKLTKP